MEAVQEHGHSLRSARRKGLRVPHAQEKDNDRPQQQAWWCGCQHGKLAVHFSPAPGHLDGAEPALLGVSRKERSFCGRHIPEEGKQTAPVTKLVSKTGRDGVWLQDTRSWMDLLTILHPTLSTAASSGSRPPRSSWPSLLS